MQSDATQIRTLSRDIIFGMVVAVLTAILGVILSQVQTSVGWKPLLVSLGVVLLVFSVIVATFQRPLIRTVARSLKAIERSTRRYPWLRSLSDIVDFETGVGAAEIWLISGDLAEDSMGGPFEKIVAKNMRAGTKYTYFLPSSPEARARLEGLRRTYGEIHKRQLVVRWLPDSFFFLVPKLDIVIYNPLQVGAPPRRAFLGIPVPEEPEHYHVEANDDFIERLVGVLLQEVEKQDDVAPTSPPGPPTGHEKRGK